MFRVFAAFAAIAFLAQVSFASAGEYGTRDEAVAMVKRVEDMFVSRHFRQRSISRGQFAIGGRRYGRLERPRRRDFRGFERSARDHKAAVRPYPRSAEQRRQLPAPCEKRLSPSARFVRSSGEQFLHFGDQFTQMDRLGQDLGVFGSAGVQIERHGGKAGDEHDLDVRIEFGGPAG